MEATGVKLKRTMCRKTLFTSSRRTNIWCFCWLRWGVVFYVHCSMDDFSKVNETRIKVVSSCPSGHVEVRCPRGKKSYQWLKTLLWCCCESPRLSKLTWQEVVTFLICGTFAVTVFMLCGVPRFPGRKLKFMRDRCKLSFPRPLARAFSRGSLRLPKWQSLLAG